MSQPALYGGRGAQKLQETALGTEVYRSERKGSWLAKGEKSMAPPWLGVSVAISASVVRGYSCQPCSRHSQGLGQALPFM
jgi:hypothetical protein